ncbi:MAG: hypothetical protein Q4D76_20125 [Oscillospiraceae bacterium]|nr:hypothetical protein [Oscillospiraceae bacterium]
MIEYKQIPKLVEGKCRLCKKTVSQHKTAVVYIYNSEMDSKKISVELLYCPSCKIKYANANIFTQIRLNNKGYRAVGFMLNSKSGRKALIEKASTFPNNYERNKKNKKTEHPHPGFDAYSIKGNAMDIDVHIVNDFNRECVICNKKLTPRTIFIPISESLCVRFKGDFCGEHFLTKPSKKMQQLLDGNPYAKHIKPNFDYYFRNYLFANEVFSKSETYFILLLMKRLNKERKKTNAIAVIISNEEREICPDVQIIDYKGNEARQLLTDIFKRDKKDVVYSNNTYHVYYMKTKDSYADIVPDGIVIQSGGGYHRSIKNKQYELIHVLMYSPYTQKYELICATYDKMEYICFIDISIFRSFISKYGNPGIEIYPPTYNTGRSDFLNEESLLHIFGYNVNQKDNLSDNTRCSILAEIIDLELMQPQTIVRLLIGCSNRMRGKGHYKACAKYDHDIQYVKEYKVNPQRFLIADIGSPKKSRETMKKSL